MKPSSLLLAASLTANLALGAWLVAAATFHHDRPATPLPVAVDKASGAASAAPSSEAIGPSRPPSVWARLNAGGDLHAVVAQLRAAQFPTRVLRAIVNGLVAEKFDAERARLEAEALHTPYWKMWPNSQLDPKIGPELRRLQREQAALVRELLGDPKVDRDTEEGRALLELELGSIPLEKAERLRDANAAYNEKRFQLYATRRSSSGAFTVLPGDWEKVAAIERGFREELGTFLTPDELKEYTLRNSQASNQLKWTLGAMRPTEAEYRAVYPLYQAYLDQFPANGSTGLGLRATEPAQQAAREALFAQLGAVLPPARVEDLRTALDPSYAALNRLVSRLDLPISTSKQVSAVQRDIQQRAGVIRSDASLTPTERSARLDALSQEASIKVSDALGGSRGLDAYREFGGQWLTTISPPKG